MYFYEKKEDRLQKNMLIIIQKRTLINEILLQKRIELWGEGCAWFDMKRLGVALERNYIGSNHVIAAAKLDIPAGDPRFVFQIPQSEILANPNVTQNP